MATGQFTIHTIFLRTSVVTLICDVIKQTVNMEYKYKRLTLPEIVTDSAGHLT